MRKMTIVLVALSLAGCGSTTLPQAKVVAAQSEIKAAETIGAPSNPRAALHLKLAREALAAADAHAADGEEKEANLALQRSQLDAQLAVALTQEAEARREADVANQKVTDLHTK
jgi:Domain of unknown function (DUF4398)